MQPSRSVVFCLLIDRFGCYWVLAWSALAAGSPMWPPTWQAARAVARVATFPSVSWLTGPGLDMNLAGVEGA